MHESTLTSRPGRTAGRRISQTLKRIAMKRFALLLPAVLLLPAGLAAQSAPRIEFTSDTPLTMPDNIYLGEVAGVARNSRGDIYVYTRTGNPTINIGVARAVSHGGSRLFQFDRNGRYVREIGQGIYGALVAQQVHVDPEDNVWIVDQLSGQVIRFNPQGQITMVLSRKPEAMRVPSPENPEARNEGRGVEGESFNRPSDVAWDAAGNIYVADGYGNSRVAKYDRDGTWLMNWGQKGSAPGQFDGVSGIAIDRTGDVYVADKGNRRIQVFDGQGHYKREITGVGAPMAMCMTSGPTQYLYISNSNEPNDLESGGEIYKVALDGTVVGWFGTVGKNLGQFGTTNAIDCRDEDQLLVGELGNWRMQRVSLRP